MNPHLKDKLRNAVHFTYDLQRFRIASLNRAKEKGGDAPPVHLDDEDRAFLATQSAGLLALEKDAFREIGRLVAKTSVYPWLVAHKGIGDACAGLLVSEFDIEKAVRPSQFWSFAGLGVGDDGRALHPEKGQKLPYNSWLRTKVLFVVGGGLLKAGNETYRNLYDQYRHRKATQLGPCALCGGAGEAKQPDKDAATGHVSAAKGKLVACWNCVGHTVKEPLRDAEGHLVLDAAGEPKMHRVPRPYPSDGAPWGKGDAHRHQAALRYMAKQFLADFWRAWRLAEGLPVVPTYHEAMQGHVHAA